MKERMPKMSSESDLRVQKTCRALYDAMFVLLNRRNFNNVTVNDLCQEARISRATFYSHFFDKYDLLKHFLTEIRETIIRDVDKYDELEREINSFIFNNKKIVSNVLKEANGETLTLMREFLSSIVELTIKRSMNDEISVHHIILFNFIIGGLLNLLTWIVDNNYPFEVTMMNTYLYKMLESMAIWDAKQELIDAHIADENT